MKWKLNAILWPLSENKYCLNSMRYVLIGGKDHLGRRNLELLFCNEWKVLSGYSKALLQLADKSKFRGNKALTCPPCFIK